MPSVEVRMRGAVVASLVLGLVACDATEDPSPEGPRAVIHVEPLDLPTHDARFFVDLAIVGRGGLVSDTRGISSAHYGDGLALNYVVPCDASGDGQSRVDVSVRGLRAGSHARERLPSGLVPPRFGVGVTCVENRDTRLDLRMPVAAVRAIDDDLAIAFDDVRCRVSQTCGGDAAALEVTCTRVGGGAVELGVRDARLVCDDMALDVAPVGETRTQLGVTTTMRAAVGPRATTWSARASPADLPGCALEADLVAAPRFVGGQAPACHAWPVMQVALPIAPGACGATPDLELVYHEAGGPRVDDLIASRRAPRAEAPTPTLCQAAPALGAHPPAAAGEGGTTMREARQGFIDLAIEVVLPLAPE